MVVQTRRVTQSAGYQLVKLANGTHGVRSLAYGETCHPSVGPVAEAEALYVRQLRLVERLRDHSGEFVIWDVGLGAAANALTVLRATREATCRVRLVSFDDTLDPLRFALEHTEALGYFQGYEEVVARLATGTERRVAFQNGRQPVEWELHPGDFPTLVRSAAQGNPSAASSQAQPRAGVLPAPHVILFDAFSPKANPAMWTLPLFTDLFRLLDPARPCAMPTYSRSTLLRVTLLLAGFFVGCGRTIGMKEETTLAANAAELIEEPLDRVWLQRARRSTSAEPLIEAVYRQAPLATETWERLQRHPQFA